VKICSCVEKIGTVKNSSCGKIFPAKNISCEIVTLKK
jgi:hypothetical protein